MSYLLYVLLIILIMHISLLAGLKIFTTLLGGGANTDGIDKVDNGNTGPMQVKTFVKKFS